MVPASLLHSKCHFVSRKDIIIAKKCLKYLTFSLFLLHEYFNYLPTRYTSLIDHITSATLSKLSRKRFSRVLNSSGNIFRGDSPSTQCCHRENAKRKIWSSLIPSLREPLSPLSNQCTTKQGQWSPIVISAYTYPLSAFNP